MNQWIPLSWGCTGNALSSQWSIDDKETTLPGWMYGSYKEFQQVNSLSKNITPHATAICRYFLKLSKTMFNRFFTQQDKVLPTQSSKGKKPSQSGMSMIIQFFFLECGQQRFYYKASWLRGIQLHSGEDSVVNHAWLGYAGWRLHCSVRWPCDVARDNTIQRLPLTCENANWI